MSPASGSFWFAGQNRRCAAVAADRRKALVMQRVDDDFIIFDVTFQMVVVEFRQRVNPHSVCLDIDRKDRADTSLATIAAPKAPDKRVVLVSDLPKLLPFTSVAALFLTF